MTRVETRHAIHPDQARTMGTEELRRHFHVADLFADGEIRLVYTHYDRVVVGAAVPKGNDLVLDKVEVTKTSTFLERRELGIVNIGDPGTVSAGGQTHELDRGDVLYVGMGSGPVTFSGGGRYYLVSAPAHRSCPTRLIRPADSREVNLGELETSNKRTINQFIHPEVIESCQLTMGYTTLHGGSCWNTMPAHVHDRRMEAYLYFNLDKDQRVFHLMGEPTETRHLVVKNEEGAISPPWSIHAGAGTGSYSFVWAMAGENTDFTDMDMVAMETIR
ncbi:5-dehydro-4-deoxy-D-glucuronate isomerase [Jiella marina]|uniref:5-dehydro-4-deoxy-D-glucuronate isomerase n=1 Tax=Jiella sp. LLJ827 TaxID=2917712 RepID=UPI0021019CE1|nr:5-dehydro-4-deoxy-D-glucuronate isomerase [Jiella sp. LLJ827]MCQ0986157.1 5-dehydro-4-deoxy-D-glucuronate isomerase [Jiella sp. LLJ827]